MWRVETRTLPRDGGIIYRSLPSLPTRSSDNVATVTFCHFEKTFPISLLIVNLPRSVIHEIAHTANGLDSDKAYLRSVLRKTGRV